MRIILLLVLLSGCNYRTPSKIRFERACNIKLPREYQVISDEYQGMNQDFALSYSIKLDSLSMIVFTQSIRDSKFYNKKLYNNSHDFSKEYFDSNKTAAWIKTFDGYLFRNKDAKHSFSAIVDTIARQVDFHETLD